MQSLVFTVTVLSWKTLLFILVLALLPGAFTYAAMRVAGGSALAMAGVVTVLALPVFVFLVVQSYLVKVVVEPDRIRVGGGLYAVDVPLGALKLDQLVIGSSSAELPALGRRTNGIGMPGLSLGWFVMSRRKVFAAVSNPEDAVLIPTDLGYDIVISPDDKDGFINALEQASLLAVERKLAPQNP